MTPISFLRVAWMSEALHPGVNNLGPLPDVEISWTPRELESLAELALQEPAPPTEALVRAMRG